MTEPRRHPVTGIAITRPCSQCGVQRNKTTEFVRWRTVCKACYTEMHRIKTQERRARDREKVREIQQRPERQPPTLTFAAEDCTGPSVVPWINPIRARALGLSQTPLRNLPAPRA
jgi:ribosome-binding protein aMBF1 (putative translation factor)